MPQTHSPVVSAPSRRPHRGARRASASVRRAAADGAPRRPLEARESRVLFAAGDFDTTFSTDGAALVNFGAGSSETGTSVVALSDGKVLVGGSVGDGSNTNDVFGVARLNADGSPDLTFGGGDGLATLDFGAGDADLQSLALAPDGRIVAVGKYGTGITADWAIARFNADGTPDATFDADGMVTTNFFGEGDTAFGVDVQADGRIVVTGVANGVNDQMVVARLNGNGSYDATFNGTGQAFLDFFGSDDAGAAVKVQSDGKIIAVGGALRPGSHRQFVLARLNSNGTTDNTFGEEGLATANFGSAAFAKDVEIQTDGKYVVGGWVDTGTVDDQFDMAVARFNVNGTLDAAFGTGGHTVFAGTGGNFNGTYGVEIQQNGKILIGGTTRDAAGATAAGVGRLNIDGTPDATFGPSGRRQFAVPGTATGATQAGDLELTSDGRILLAATAPGVTAGTTDMAVVRLQNDDGAAGSISGTVFNDANENGVRDAGEAGLAGQTVYQDLNNNGAFDAGAVTVASGDVPKAISPVQSQPQTVVSNLNVSGVGTISDLDVTLNIRHTYTNDLRVSLISPDDTEILLFGNVGRGTTRDHFTGTILDDEATTFIDAATAFNPYTGRFRPQTALSNFDGKNADGTWQLKIVDTENEDGGSLDSWSLTFTTGSGEPSVTTGADGNYTFATLPAGTYTIRQVVQPGWSQTSPLSGGQVVTLAAGQAVTGRDFGNVNRVIPSAVVGRSVFYNDSAYDGRNTAATAQDDAAIAADKQALRPGQTATGANVTSYWKGLNGVMIDMTRMPSNLDADDFEFRVGTTNTPGTWATAPAPLSITERPSGHADGSTRVTIVWANNVIRNRWLQVTVKANADTRLASPDVFYFGNLVGETPRAGSTPPFVINALDVLDTRSRLTRRAGLPVTEVADHNKDGRVNAWDYAIVRANYGRTLNTLAVPVPAAFSDVSIQSAARRSRGVPVTRSVLA